MVSARKLTDVDSWLLHCKDGGLLPEKKLRVLCEKVKELLVEESNVVYVAAPVTIVGNTQGKHNDVVKMFEEMGELPHKSYVFLGDYVNRGYMSVENFQHLMCLKLRYPDRITLLRGHYEDQ